MGDRAMAALRETVAAKPADGSRLIAKKESRSLGAPPGASLAANCVWCGAEIVVCVRCTHCRAGPKYCRLDPASESESSVAARRPMSIVLLLLRSLWCEYEVTESAR